MGDSAGQAQPSVAREVPAAELVRRLSEQVPLLIREELKLARLEMTRKGKEAGAGAGMFGVASIGALYGLGCLLAAAGLALSMVLAGWLAALIVGAVVLVPSAAVALAGRGRLRRAAPPVPLQAADGLRADVDEIKERAHR